MPIPDMPWRLEWTDSPRKRPCLVPGTIYRAHVVGCPDHGPVAIDIADTIVHVGSHPGLRLGDRLLLKLERLWPTVVFRLILRKNEGLGSIEVNI